MRSRARAGAGLFTVESTFRATAATQASTNSELSPSGSHQLPMSSAPFGSPTVRDQTNAANAESGRTAAASQAPLDGRRGRRPAVTSELPISPT